MDCALWVWVWRGRMAAGCCVRYGVRCVSGICDVMCGDETQIAMGQSHGVAGGLMHHGGAAGMHIQ